MSHLDLKTPLRQIGDYQVIKQIGEGALGKVFLVEHRFLKKQYAIKLLPEELASDRGFVQRFEKEVAMLALLDHPHIVKMHNVSFADGQYFLVTDCIVDSLNETTNLTDYLSNNSADLMEDEILNICEQIASALDYAHQKNIADEPLIHRGIKLNNILVGKAKEGINVYLSDFGLSRMIGTGAVLSKTYKMVSDAQILIEKYPQIQPESGKLTKMHLSFMQTYAFLAPEQKIGLDVLDNKVDIYSFGILIYYLIMRQFPEGFFELPSSKRKDLKHHWDLLFYRCLQHDPRLRPASLKAVIDEVKSLTFDAQAKAHIHRWNHLSEIIERVTHQTTSVPARSKEAPKPLIKPQELVRPELDDDPAKMFHVDSTIAKYTPKHVEIKNVDPLHTDMVVIEGETFYRGSTNGGRDEMPRHAVRLSSYAIDIHPVTNEQFVRFLDVMGGEKDANNIDIIRLRESRIKREGGKLHIESGYAKHPVVGVTWYGAIAYAKWIGKRLPTEAEWEISAYGGIDGAQYPTGENIERSQANYFSSDTTAVMSYPPNGYGLYDMAGNVYEWCQDWYAYNYYETSMQEPDDPKGPLQGVYRVLRGGCWKSLKEDLRCSHRHRNNPGIVNRTYGFRCAADVAVDS